MNHVPETGKQTAALSARPLLDEARKFCQTHLGQLLRLFIFPAVASFLVYQLSAIESAKVWAAIHPSPGFARSDAFMLAVGRAGAYRWGSFLLTWTLYCFVYAGVSEFVRGWLCETEASNRSMFDRARDLFRIMPASVLMFFLLLFVLLIVGLSAVMILDVLRTDGRWIVFAIYGSIAFGLAVCSRWFFWIPVLVHEETTLLASFRRSTELCAHVDVAVIIFLLEAFLAALIAAMAPGYLMGFIGRMVALPSYAGWLRTFLEQVMLLAVEPVLLVGLSIAYFRAREQETLQREALAAAGLAETV